MGKFPIPELLLIVVGLQVGMGMFNISGDCASGAFPTCILLSMTITNAYMRFVYFFLNGTISDMFLTISLFVAVLVSLSFSNEIENGMFKTALSRPVDRKTLFLTKFVSLLLIVNIISCAFVFLSIFLLDISTWSQFLSAWKGWGLTMLLMVISSFFVASLGVFVSMLSKSTAITSLVTIGIIAVMDTVSGKIVFLPGRSIEKVIFYAFSGDGLSNIEAVLAIGMMPLVGFMLFILSYHMFTRGLDIN